MPEVAQILGSPPPKTRKLRRHWPDIKTRCVKQTQERMGTTNSVVGRVVVAVVVLLVVGVVEVVVLGVVEVVVLEVEVVGPESRRMTPCAISRSMSLVGSTGEEVLVVLVVVVVYGVVVRVVVVVGVVVEAGLVVTEVVEVSS